MKASLTEDKPLVTVVVLNHEGRETVEKCIMSVLSQDYPNYEVIVVDNASSDSSVALVREYVAKIKKLLTSSRNRGYAAGMNLGAVNASDSSQFLAFVTQDVVLPPYWLRRMVRSATVEEDIAAVSPRIYDESKRAHISELRILYPSAYYYVPLNSKGSPAEVDFPAGEAFLVRRSCFLQLGMFDDDYFAYYEDGDLGWRARLTGLKVLYAPDVEVRHHRSSVFGGKSLQYRVYLFERNRILSCMKNLAAKSLLAFAVSEALMLLFHFCRALIRRDSEEMGKAYVHALWRTVQLLPLTLRKRRAVQSMRKCTDKILFRNSLPKHAKVQPGLVLAFSPEHKRKESYYLLLLDTLATIMPPS